MTNQTSWNIKPLSDKQVEFYFTLCNRKRKLPADLTGVTSAQLSKMIDDLTKAPTPATEKQINMIRTIIAELVDAGVEGVKMPTQKYYDSLTIESVQDQIKKAQAIRAKNFDKLKPSEQQLEEIGAWYGFVEVDWETYGIQTRIFAQTYNAWVTEEVETVVEEEQAFPWEIKRPSRVAISGSYIGESQWRYMTKDEFKAELTAKLTHANASALLDKYRSAFRTFNNTRISQWQKDQIKKLEQRMANLYVPKEVTIYHIDQELGSEGEVMEEGGGFESEGFDVDYNTFSDIDSPFAQDTGKKSVVEWKNSQNGYVFTDDIQLDMMDRNSAEKFIKQLQYELTLPSLRASTGAQNLDYADASIEETRTASDIARARTDEFKNLNNFLYGLCDVVGMHFEVDGRTVESLRHDAVQIFFDRENGASDEKKQALRNEITDFMKLAIMNKCIKFEGLMNLADRSQMAGELVDELIEDPAFAVQLMKLQRNQY